jgi:hypothetical protein
MVITIIITTSSFSSSCNINLSTVSISKHPPLMREI